MFHFRSYVSLILRILGISRMCHLFTTPEFSSSLEFPEVIVLHCSTDDLWWTVTPKIIACEIVALGTSVKTEKNAIIVSDIIAHKDRYKDKARDTNECLKTLCNSRNIPFVDHIINIRAHINYGGLH